MPGPRLKIADHPFFTDIPAEFIERVEECAEDIEFEERDIILREGEEVQNVYLIFEGRVAIETKSNHRGLIRIQEIGAGEVLGWSWFFPPYECYFDARAIEPVRAVGLDSICMRALCDLNHDFGYLLTKRVAEIIVDRLTTTRRQLIDRFD